MEWMYHSLLNHLPIEKHLGCFGVQAITNKATMNMPDQIFV